MLSRRLAPSLGLALGMVVMSLSQASAQSGVLGVGSWKLNVTKSKLGSQPMPQSITSTIVAVGQGTKMTGVRIGSDGIRSEARYTAHFDGKDYPLTGSPNADTISLKRIDARTIERTDKKAGKVVETSTTIFSKDGKTSTTTGKATNANGEDFHFVVVNEKQQSEDGP
jgi:hypothetical protein